MPQSLRNVPLVRALAKTQKSLDDLNARFPGIARGTVRAKVVDVDDPQERGRVRVLFDAMNAEDIPQVEGAGVYSEARSGAMDMTSHWIDTSPAFKGKQPPGLIGKRVNVVLSNGQYQYAILLDVVHDPENLTEKSASNLNIPNNSSMTRLPVYPAGQLPPPTEENIGCVVIEEGGPMGADWMCVCLKRDGRPFWVRHSDLAHGHAGGDDGTQQVDSMGNRQSPVMMGTVGANVFPASHFQLIPNSSYSTRPAGNPYGEEAMWSRPPMNTDLPFTKGKDFNFLNPDPNISLDAVRKVAGFSPSNLNISGFVPSLSASVPTFVQPKAAELLSKAQKTLALAQEAKKIVDNPTEFVKSQTLSAAQAAANKYIPPGTAAACSAISNAQGTLNLPSLASITPFFEGVLSGVQKVVVSTIQNLL